MSALKIKNAFRPISTTFLNFCPMNARLILIRILSALHIFYGLLLALFCFLSINKKALFRVGDLCDIPHSLDLLDL